MDARARAHPHLQAAPRSRGQPIRRPDRGDVRMNALSDSPDAPTVLMEVADGVATISLNRPDRMNAVDFAMMEELPARMREAARRTDVRVILVTGEGRAFCAGADISVLGQLGDGDAEVKMPGRDLLLARTIPKPVIAVVHGACAGIGLVFALAADVRFAAPDAK